MVEREERKRAVLWGSGEFGEGGSWWSFDIAKRGKKVP